MASSSEATTSTIRFKAWPTVKREVLTAIREVATEDRAQNIFPTSILMEGYPGAGISTCILAATWKGKQEIKYRVRIYLDRNSSVPAEVL